MFLTAKNRFNSDFETLNLGNYVLRVDYFYEEKEKYQYELFLLLQYKSQTGAKIAIINFKIYKNLRSSQVSAFL